MVALSVAILTALWLPFVNTGAPGSAIGSAIGSAMASSGSLTDLPPDSVKVPPMVKEHSISTYVPSSVCPCSARPGCRPCCACSRRCGSPSMPPRRWPTQSHRRCGPGRNGPHSPSRREFFHRVVPRLCVTVRSGLWVRAVTGWRNTTLCGHSPTRGSSARPLIRR